MKKKIIIIFLLSLIVCMSFCISGVAFADSYVNRVNQYVYDFANEFVKIFDGAEIRDAIPIYDVDDNVNSCCFTIYKDNQPYMYIILDNYYREGISPVIEIGFGEYKFDKNEKIVSLNYIDYGIKKRNNKIEFNNQEYEVKECKRSYPQRNNKINLLANYEPIENGYFDSLQGMTDQIKKVAFMDGFLDFKPFIQDDFVDQEQMGAGICGATTAMNVLKYYHDTQCILDEIYDDPIGVYNILRNYQTSSNPYNIETLPKIKDALSKYIKNYTSYRFTPTNYLFNSWWSIYNDVNRGRVVLYRYDGLSGGKEMGHIILAIGAVSYKSGWDFIYVADTWNYNLRWLNYGYHDNIGCMSIKINGFL